MKYFITYIIMFLLWTVFVVSYEEIDGIKWAAIAVTSLVSLIPVVIYNFLRKIGL